MANLALPDLLLACVLRREILGSFHALASAVRVTSYEQAADPLGVTVRGRGEFNGSKLFPDMASAVIRDTENDCRATSLVSRSLLGGEGPMANRTPSAVIADP